jgi:hypothetical protein
MVLMNKQKRRKAQKAARRKAMSKRRPARKVVKRGNYLILPPRYHSPAWRAWDCRKGYTVHHGTYAAVTTYIEENP